MKECKLYGIRVRIPKSDPMAAEHLLGDNWQSERWFETADARDQAFEAMSDVPANYRKGDKPSIELTKVDP